MTQIISLLVLTESYPNIAFGASIRLSRKSTFWTNIFCVRVSVGLTRDDVNANSADVRHALQMATESAIYILTIVV